ncbi:MAG: ATP synthase F1 subunit gamma [Bryobacterales bacterium]|jgi:F-type H+-transporting ATPase subunit gamma|nr:ATP synthase F1 subunit gamma [Bryobacterales bacterium]
MPSLLDLRRRIRSVKNTQQITRAMKIVSAARLRRAQDRVTAARPYAKGFGEVLEQIAASVRGADAGGFEHPLLETRPEKRILVFVVTSDRGLCGAYNANLIKNARRFVDEKAQAGISVDLHTVGRKGDEFFRKRSYSIRDAHIQFLAHMTYLQVEQMAHQLVKFYSDRDYDAVYLLYTEFRSAASQLSTQKLLLPVSLPQEGDTPEYLFDQPAEALLASMLNQYVVLSLYQSLLEANASEHGARMTAMDSATRNASEMIQKLTMRLNRVRQASITTELIEVVSGAQALD